MMAHPPPDHFAHSASSPIPIPQAGLSQSTNGEHHDVSDSFRRLSLNVAATNPSASYSRSLSRSPSRTFSQHGLSASPNSNPPLRRTPSLASLEGGRSTTPALHKRASMNSLHGLGGHTPTRTTPSRRLSSTASLNGLSSSPGQKSPLNDVVEAPRPTAATIAKDHFTKDLHQHNMDEEGRPADTIVILQDACYGHRYSRPRTSRASLSTIVERPERLIASIVGVSVAYVRLGERYSGGLYPIHPRRDPSTVPNIPFRIRKTARSMPLASPAVTNVHGTKWMEELKIMCDNAEARLAMNGKELTRPVMNRGPDEKEPAKFHEGDLYLCSESLNAMEGALGAVCEGIDSVFNGTASGKGPHRAFVAIRPPGHHCSASFPSGFCWLNNVHVGINHAALTHGLTHAAIIDFDLHHGDGSQAIAWQHNMRATSLPKNAAPWKKTSIGYFSLHDINSYPCEMGDEEKVKNASLCIENAHGQNIWNVHLQPWKNESEFWTLYETKYAVLLEKTRNFLRSQTERLNGLQNGPRPKSAIFLSAGFDASEWESSGMQRHKVNVPTEFYARLTRDVVKLAAEDGTAVEGRVISVLEGGYSDRALCSGVLSHISGLATRDTVPMKVEDQQHGGLGYEMGQKIGAIHDSNTFYPQAPQTLDQYDPSWWALPRLEQLDTVINPIPVVTEQKKSKDSRPATFFSPTQSSIAKVQSPRLRRSTSNLAAQANSESRPASPPPPEVDWIVAAQELSKLLIPNDRQTLSCTPEDLSAEATKARRDRQSLLNPVATVPIVEAPKAEGPRKSLRERKPVKPAFGAVDDVKANRRQTIGTPLLAANKTTGRETAAKTDGAFSHAAKQSNRRLSLASTTGSASSEVTSARNNTQSRESSIPPSVPSRTGTSLSTRPTSSTSSRGPAMPAVKKTRAPRQTTTQATKTSAVRRKSPLSEAKALPGAAATQAGQAGSRQPSGAGPSTAKPPSNGSADIDSLTSGMKKIKISLTTKAQREAQAAAKAAEEAARKAVPTANISVEPQPSAVPAITPQPPTPHEADLPSVLPAAVHATLPDAVPPAVPTTSDFEEQNEPTLPAHPSTPQAPPSNNLQPWQMALPSSSPMSLPSSTGPSAPPSSHSEAGQDIFIPYQPKGPTQNQTVHQEQLTWLPPNTTTPSPIKRGELPVFTASSAIPFGVNTNAHRPSSAPPPESG